RPCFSFSHGTQNDVSRPPEKASTIGSAIVVKDSFALPGRSGARELPGKPAAAPKKNSPRGSCILEASPGSAPRGVAQEKAYIGIYMQARILKIQSARFEARKGRDSSSRRVGEPAAAASRRIEGEELGRPAPEERLEGKFMERACRGGGRRR